MLHGVDTQYGVRANNSVLGAGSLQGLQVQDAGGHSNGVGTPIQFVSLGMCVAHCLLKQAG